MLISWAWLSVLDLFNPPQPRWYIPPWRLQSGGKTNMKVKLAIDSNGGNGWWFEYLIFRERVGTRGTCGGICLTIVEYFSQNKIFFGRIFLLRLFLVHYWMLQDDYWLSSNSGTIMTRRHFTQRSTICETSTDGAPSSPRQKHLSRRWLTARYLISTTYDHLGY